MKKRLITRAEFARLANVSGAAVTKACSGVLQVALDGKRIDVKHPSAVKYIQDKTGLGPKPPATGIDVVYEDAVKFCKERGKYSISSIQREFRIGYERAKKIVNVMNATDALSQPTTPTVVIQTPHVRGTAAAKEKKKKECIEDDIIQIPENIQSFLQYTLADLIDQFGTDTRFIDWLNATQKIEGINEKRLKNATTEGKLINRELVENGVIDTFNSAHLRLLKDGAKSIAAGVISKHVGGSELAEIELFVTKILGSFIKPVKSKIVRILKNG